MQNMNVYSDKKHCSGCSGCYNICPKECIEMQQDEEGFLYPRIDEKKCIKCNLCSKVCPYNNDNEDNDIEKPKAFACIHKDIEVVKKSTSGGAFTAIAESICKEEYVIFGAALNENVRVVHKYIADIKDIDLFRSSKYVQSDISKSLKDVKTFLDKGKKVIFTGTPCQIAGIKSFLRKDYENLITIDLVCHGVPSPLVFEKYKEYMEKIHNSRIKHVNFRDKTKKWDEHNMTIKFENGAIYTKRGVDDAFEVGFYKHLYHRPSCHQCPFSRIPRVGDFTLGDLWGIDDIIPQINDKKGISLLLFNTKKSEAFVKEIKERAKLIEINLNDAVANNKNLIKCTEESPNRIEFMNDMQIMKYSQLKEKYLKPRPLSFRIVSKVLNKKTKVKIKKMLGMKK
ncbi:coenzyme F420-reducing hydrogenase, beta subunit [Clostridium saccharoperbutylacetonicum N1-4(HMT)]|uniref:Coenzyme F420-reducing hydrogenase, beta subunit n=3 Tax=Clostridium saccharoperbutylacetonicum TaxID=36745 RepID=M1LQ19_9CLOT|nr:coenzyme F420-reducing hydrogenase, beta subunit [Clostridium saccharoperbutylacetonicum N1-4(HMT)]